MHISSFRLFLIVVISFCSSQKIFAADTLHPCHGGLLSLIDRPTYGNSACTAPRGQALLEQGIQIERLIGKGTEINYPEAELRLGLPHETEFTILFPLYNQQSVYPYTGLEATIVGFKHILSNNSDTVWTTQVLIIPPSGSKAFGSQGTGGKLEGIWSHGFYSHWNITLIASLNTQTAPISSNGVRYNSILLDGVLAWELKNEIQCYIEFYGQTQSSQLAGLGINADAGLIYVPKPNITLDIEIGQRLVGNFGAFERYIGSGIVIQF
jgi:hypothetical protein